MTQTMSFRFVRLLLVLTALMVLVPGALAQDGDRELVLDAARRTSEANAYTFSFDMNVGFTGVPGSEASVDLTGSGTLADGAIDLQLDGRMDAAGTGMPMTLNLRIVDGVAYFNSGDGGWTGAPLDELMPLISDVMVSSYRTGFEGTSAGIPPLESTELGSASDPVVQETLNALHRALGSLDVNEFASLERFDDETIDGEPVAHFTSSIAVADLISSESGMNLLVGLLRLGDPSSPAEFSSAEMNALGTVIGQVFKDTALTIDYYVGLNDAYLRRTLINLDMSIDPAQMGEQGDVIDLNITFDVSLNDIDGALTVEAPENAMVMNGIASMLGLDATASTTAANTIPEIEAAQQATLAPVTGAGEPIVANAPTAVELSPDGPTDLIYSASDAETINVVARSLEEPGTVDTTLEVLTTNGTRLSFNDDHGGDRDELAPFDSALEELELPGAGDYIIRVTTFTGAGAGQVELTVESGSAPQGNTTLPQATAVPNTNQTTDGVNDVIDGTVPEDSGFTHTFEGSAGQVVTITVRATGTGALDPKAVLLEPDGDVLAENDDHGSDDESLSNFDSRIEAVTLPDDGEYTIDITGFAGTGGDFELTISSGGEPESNDPPPTTGDVGDEQVFTGTVPKGDGVVFDFEANAGDVYTFTAVNTGGDLDPQVYIFDDRGDLVIANDDHGTSDRSLDFTDSRIHNFIFTDGGSFTVEVFGYQETAGDFELTITPVATGAPTNEGSDDVVSGEIEPNDTFTTTFEAQAGDYVTITVAAQDEDMDPQVALLDDEGTILADNDDHGTSDESLNIFDSRIHNFIVPASGEYTIEVTGYQESAGAFEVIINTKR